MKMSEVAKLYKIPPETFAILQTKEDKEKFFINNPLSDNFYQELEMDSKYADAHQDVSFDKEQVNLHSHEFYELLYCRTGKIEYYLGTERFKVESGDVIIAPPGISHRPIFPEKLEEPYRRYVMWISKEMMNIFKREWELEPTFINKPMFIHTAGTSYKHIKDLFSNACYENVERNIGWQASIFGMSCELVSTLARMDKESEGLSIPENPELIDEIIMYIEEHLSDKITLDLLSKHFFVSKSTISKEFKKKLDISFYQHVTSRRLISSKNHLLSGDPIDDICQNLGFNDYSTFFKAFKKEYGISPTQFKKLYSNNNSDNNI